MAVVKDMYNMRLRTHELPKQSVMKRIMYAVKTEGVWPDPARVTLEMMRLKPTDKAYTLFKRLLMAVCTASAGARAPAGLRDDGAGVVTGYGVQWCSATAAVEVLKSVDEVRPCRVRTARRLPPVPHRSAGSCGQVIDPMEEHQQLSMFRLISLVLHKGTALGSETPSLLLSRAVSRVPEYAHQQGDADDKSDDSTPRKKAPRTKATPSTPRTTAAKPEKGKKGARKRKRGNFEDKAGAMGPNELPRMKGGNPEGARCEHLDKPGGSVARIERSPGDSPGYAVTRASSRTVAGVPSTRVRSRTRGAQSARRNDARHGHRRRGAMTAKGRRFRRGCPDGRKAVTSIGRTRRHRRGAQGEC